MQERICMIKLREILRLRYEKRLTCRKIGISCNVGRQTVANYITLAKISNINWEEDKNLSDDELEKKLYKGKPGQVNKPGRSNKPEPDYEYLDKELKRAGVTLQLLWSEYKQDNPGGYQYEMFCLLYNRWKNKQSICMRQNHKAGEKLFIDYDGDKIPIIDLVTGEEIMTELFVSVWGASNYTYAEATLTQQLPDWIMSHVRAFEYFGCVPNVCVPDNLKSGITRACWYEPEVNGTYHHLAQYYGTVVIPARPRRAKDKAKAEAGVLLVKRWIIAVLRNRRFYSLGELNAAIRELLIRLNNKPLVKIKKSRKELFELYDKPAALPLPGKPYEYAEWKKCRVNIDYHIEVDVHYYSVPYQLNKEQVDVRVTSTIVEIIYRNKRIVSHVRSYVKGGHTTLKEHMPQSHQQYLEWTPSRIIDWAAKAGPNIAELVKQILKSREYPEQGYRSCLGIMRLQKGYPVDRLEKACYRALKYQLYSYKSVKNILESNLDRQVELELINQPISPVHENIRGDTYYGGNHVK